jgi:hypothetical protein
MASGLNISLVFPQADVNRIVASMARARSELGVSMPHSVNMAGRAVLGSLAASTKVSEKHRTFQATGERSRSGLNKRFNVWTRYATPKRKGKATRASGRGPWRWQPIWARNVQELKRRPAMRIVMRGVAKASFGQAMKKGNFGFPASAMAPGVESKNKRIMLKAAHRWVDFTRNLKGDNPFIKMVNNLTHIMAALQNGPQTVETAMGRAADGMEKNITKQLARRGFT